MATMKMKLSVGLFCLLVGLVSFPGSKSACSGSKKKSNADADRATDMGSSWYQQQPEKNLNMGPYLLASKISKNYGIDRERMFNQLGREFIYGSTGLETPLIAIRYIIRKVFEDSSCRTSYICKVGSSMHQYRDKISIKIDEAKSRSKLLSALIFGIRGGDCNEHYESQCKPILKDPYKSWATNPFGTK